jgi:hypothetical protein
MEPFPEPDQEESSDALIIDQVNERRGGITHQGTNPFISAF